MLLSIQYLFSVSRVMTTSPDHNGPRDEIVALLASAPHGLSALEILASLEHQISQPTLSRRLMDLRARGRIAAFGKARATRYFFTGSRGELAALRSRMLHERIARRIARNPALIDQVRRRLARLSEVNPSGRNYHQQWGALLDADLPALLRTMVADSERSDVLRKESPFTVLATREDRQRVFSGQ
ncbi:MAG: hypothetical protein ACNA8J_03045 [Gammaproteobacteria bacterium]